MINIAFWSNQLCERGTEVALYDYAFYNQSILKNKSFVFYDKNNKNNKDEVIQKFKKEFVVFGVNTFDDVDAILLSQNIKIIYIIKAGFNDGIISKVAKNIIHCVFNCFEPHGDVYCSISNWVNGNNGKFKVLPHIVHLPEHNEDMRSYLNIPKDSIVIGRHGGFDTFDLSIVHSTVYEIAKIRKDVYFLFVNTNKFCNSLPNIIHIDQIVDLSEKRKFINTCDAMLWARSGGETFGLAIAEFSISNKPVIACKIGDVAHVHLLGNKGLWYSNQYDLVNYISNIKQFTEKEKNWNVYQEYTPEKVMKLFDDIVKSLE